ncbi:MAG TPA: pentapeptide repeat-containing protein [Acidimicrobiia bacterium]|nr:pentapeptide repeat-containing protein [Acidimicrobiia bacterium]
MNVSAFGRTPSDLVSPWQGSDAVFSSKRIDGSAVVDASFSHCTFIKVSFKDCQIERSRFFDCTFVDCYFRSAQVRESGFVGSRFIDCLFPSIEITGSDFRFARFENCSLDPGEVRSSMPREHNLREELSARLEVAALQVGRSKDASTYKLWAIEARESHLLAAIRSENTYYRQHFPGLERFKAAVQWFGSKLNGWLWGYGEKWTVLVRNLMVATVVVFPGLFWLNIDGLRKASGDPNFADLLLVSLNYVFQGPGFSSLTLASTTTRILAAMATAAGLVSAGLLITMLFKAVTRR